MFCYVEHTVLSALFNALKYSLQLIYLMTVLVFPFYMFFSPAIHLVLFSMVILMSLPVSDGETCFYLEL